MSQTDEAIYELVIQPLSHSIRAQFFLDEGRLMASDNVYPHRQSDLPARSTPMNPSPQYTM